MAFPTGTSQAIYFSQGSDFKAIQVINTELFQGAALLWHIPVWQKMITENPCVQYFIWLSDNLLSARGSVKETSAS